MLRLPSREVWAVDTEYNYRPSPAYAYPGAPQPDGSIQHPICLVARELYSGRVIMLREGEFGPEPPFSFGPENLVIAYNAVAECSTFLALKWPLPQRIFDCYVEYRRHICGVPGRDLKIKGNKDLLRAQQHFGIEGISAETKTEMRDFILRGGSWSWTGPDWRRVLEYCASDVEHLFELTEHLLHDHCCGPALRSEPNGLAQALHRGRYMRAAAIMEHNGIPLDVDTLAELLDNWGHIRDTIIAEKDTLGVYPGGHFNNDLFLARVAELEIPWTLTGSGLPKLEKEYLKDMVAEYPDELTPFYTLRQHLSDLHLGDLPIGSDQRSRTSVRPFVSGTGRNQPLASKYIFGLPKWTRHLVKPAEGMSLAYLDYRNQEYHIAGVLSGDEELLEMLKAPDPYIAFAFLAGLAPEGATKQSHPKIRAICKVLLLGTNYGMGAELFAVKAGIPVEQAKFIHNRLRLAFPRYYEWSSEVVREARAGHWLTTVFGWHQCMDIVSRTGIKNWPMQAGGAEMLRLACCLLTEAGIRVCGPIHDAALIESATDQIHAAVTHAVKLMEEASRVILDGHTVPVDTVVVSWPDRYMPDDDDDRAMWDRVLGLRTGTGG